MPQFSINAQDLGSQQAVWIGVRDAGPSISLAISLKDDGDIEILLPPTIARELAEKIQIVAKGLEGT
jgi:hypothetical protein